MVKQNFTHVTTWVFDLDNTLYPPRYRLFDQIEVKMTDWVMQALKVGRTEANRLRQHYWATYGTTLSGLMREHAIDPGPYLTEVHDIDFSILPRDPDLAAAVWKDVFADTSNVTLTTGDPRAELSAPIQQGPGQPVRYKIPHCFNILRARPLNYGA